jgi:RNA polymerase sigma-70 factor (ECF subfamily)
MSLSLRNTRKTVAVSSAPPEELASSLLSGGAHPRPLRFSAAMLSDSVAAHASSRMDEESFRLFYERTARPLRAYLRGALRDASKADDLLQESYLRFLQAKLPEDMTDEHRKNYLFRIATNLFRDEVSKRANNSLEGDYPSEGELARDVIAKTDMRQSLAQLNLRERNLLWLAYVERFSHQEIAAMVGVKTPSVRPMLARARTKLSGILKAGGWRRQDDARDL